MSGLSVEDAIKFDLKELNKLLETGKIDQEGFNAGFQGIIHDLDPGKTDGVTVLWSQWFGDVHTGALSATVGKSSDDLRIIQTSPYADFLEDVRVQEVFGRANGLIQGEVNDDALKAVANSNELYEQGWRTGSEAFVANGTGKELLMLTPDGDKGIFAETEFPTALKNPHYEFLNGASKADMLSSIEQRGIDLSNITDPDAALSLLGPERAIVNQPMQALVESGALDLVEVGKDGEGRPVFALRNPDALFGAANIETPADFDTSGSRVLGNVPSLTHVDLSGLDRADFDPDILNALDRATSQVDNHSGTIGKIGLALLGVSIVQIVGQKAEASEWSSSSLEEKLNAIQNSELFENIDTDKLIKAATEFGAEEALLTAGKLLGGPIALAVTGYELYESYGLLRAVLDIQVSLDPNNEVLQEVHANVEWVEGKLNEWFGDDVDPNQTLSPSQAAELAGFDINSGRDQLFFDGEQWVVRSQQGSIRDDWWSSDNASDEMQSFLNDLIQEKYESGEEVPESWVAWHIAEQIRNTDHEADNEGNEYFVDSVNGVDIYRTLDGQYYTVDPETRDTVYVDRDGNPIDSIDESVNAANSDIQTQADESVENVDAEISIDEAENSENSTQSSENIDNESNSEGLNDIEELYDTNGDGELTGDELREWILSQNADAAVDADNNNYILGVDEQGNIYYSRPDGTVMVYNEETGESISLEALRAEQAAEQARQQEIDATNQAVQTIDQNQSAVDSNQTFVDSLTNGSSETQVLENFLDSLLAHESAYEFRESGALNRLGDPESNQADGSLGIYTQAHVGSVASALGLYNAINNADSDGWDIAGASVSLVNDLANSLSGSVNDYGTLDNDLFSNDLSSQFASVISLAGGWDDSGDIDRADSLVSTYEAFAGVDSADSFGAAISFAADIDNGDWAGAILSGAQLYASFGGQGASAFLGAGGSYGPYVGYASAAVSLLQGDVQGAAVSALSTAAMYLPIPGQPIAGMVIGMVVSSMFSSDPPDPEASLVFLRNDDGSLGTDIGHNSTGQGLGQMLEAQANPLVDMLLGLESTLVGLPNNQLNVGDLPEIRVTTPYGDNVTPPRWELHGGNNLGNAIQVLDENDQEGIYRGLRDTAIISHLNPSMIVGSRVINGIGQTFYSPFGYPIAGGTRVVNVRGTGVFIGGGNVNGTQGVVRANNVVSTSDRAIPTPTRELQQIMDSQVIPQNLFAGDAGRLLAMALGTGAIALSDVAISDDILAPLREHRDDLYDNEAYAAIIEDSTNVIAGGETVSFEAPPTFNYVSDGSVSSVSIGGDSNDGGGNGGRGGSGGALSGAQGAANTAAATGVTEQGAVLANNVAVHAAVDDDDDRESIDFVGIDAASDESVIASQVETTPVEAIVDPIPVPTPEPEPEPEPEPLTSGRADSFSMLEDRSVFIDQSDLLENDGASTFIRLGTAERGTVSMDEAGQITFTPEANYATAWVADGEQTAGFSYWIINAHGLEEEVWVDVVVANVHDNPDAVDDAITAVEDTVINLSDRLMANDLRVDGGADSALSIEDISASVGTLSQNTDGDWLYTPPADYVGEVQLLYVVSNVSGQTAVAGATITYTDDGVDAPVLNPDDLDFLLGQGVEEQPYTFNASDLLANDDVAQDGARDASVNAAAQEGQALTVTAIRLSDPSQGSVSYDAETGEIVFTPAANVNGDVTFVYTASNGEAQSESTATVTLANVLDAFSAQGVNQTVVEDSVDNTYSINELVQNIISEDGAARISAVRMVAADDGSIPGQVLLNDGEVQFIPSPNFSGDAQFEVRLDNGFERIAVPVTVTVEGVNDAPVYEDGAPILETQEGEVLSFHQDDLLQGVIDPEGDSFSLSGLRLFDETQGALTVDASGNATFTAADNVSGDVTLLYTLTDSHGASRLVEATIEVAGTNDIAQPEDQIFDAVLEDVERTFSLEELLAGADTQRVTTPRLDANDQPVLDDNGDQIIDMHYEDVDGDVLRVVNPTLSDPNAGTLAIGPDGEVVYTPSEDYTGDDNGEVSFTYLIDDGNAFSDPVTATFSVTAVNDAPRYETVAPTFEGVEDTVLELTVEDVLTGAVDVEGDDFNLTAISLVDATQGTIEYDQDTGTIRYTPAADVHGDVSFNITLTDSQGESADYDSIIALEAVNDTIALDDVSLDAVTEDQTLVITQAELLQGHTTDADGETLTITDVALVDDAVGTIAINADGDIEFTPTQNYTGDDNGEVSFTYQVDDSVEVSDPVTATFSITAQNDAPEAEAFSVDGAEDVVTVFSVDDLLAVAHDVEGDDFAVSDVRLNNPTQGTLTFDVDSGEIRVETTPDFSGELVFEYDLAEKQENGLTSTQTGTVVVANTDDDDFSIADSTLNLIEGQTTVLTATALLGAYATQTNAEGLAVESDGQILSISGAQVLGADEASVAISVGDDGQSISVNPSEHFNGDFQIQYTVTDGTHEQVVTIASTVEAVNDAPEGIDHIGELALAEGMEETDVEISVDALLAGSSDIEDDAFTVSDVRLQNPDQGAVVIMRDDSGAITGITFSPAENISGVVLFDYDLSELESGLTATYQAEVNVVGINDTAEIVDQSYTQEQNANEQVFNLFEDQIRIYTPAELIASTDAVLNDDGQWVDADGEVLSIVAVEMVDSSQGTVELLDDGNVQFTPSQHYVGEAAFQISVHDNSDADPVQATITVNTWALNDGPVRVDQTAAMVYDVAEEGELRIAGSDVLAQFEADVEGEAYRIVGIEQTDSQGNPTANGEVIYDAASDEVIYRPNENYYGDSVFQIVVEDESGAYQTVAVNVGVSNTYDGIEARADEVILDEGVAHVFTVDELTANDVNPDNDTLRIVSIDSSTIESGQLTLNADGTVSYLPEGGAASEWTGSQTFTYTIENSAGGQSTAQARITVNEVNDAPIIEAQSTTLLEDTSVTFNLNDLLANATDVEGDWMSITDVEVDRAYGEVTYDQAAGTVTFTPSAHFNSQLTQNTDSDGNILGPVKPELRYRVEDERGAASWGVVEMDVTPVNDAPVAGDDDLFVWGRGPRDYGNPNHETRFFVNDQEVDEEHDQLTISDVTQGLHGEVRLLDDGTIEYRADAGYIGEDVFRYTVTDGVTHEVTGEALDYDSSDVATVNVQVVQNHAPITIGDVGATVQEDRLASISFDQVYAAVFDEDFGHAQLPERFTVVGFENETYGSASIQNGQIVYQLDDHFNSTQFEAPASFAVIVEDIVGHQTSVTVNLAVSQVNDPPVANSETIGTIQEDGEGLIFSIRDLLENDRDVDRDLGSNPDDFLLFQNILVSNQVGERVGSRETTDPGEIYTVGDWATFNPEDYRGEDGNFDMDAYNAAYEAYLDNEFQFVPNANWNGNAPIVYTVSDSRGATDTVTSTIRVNPENDIPILELKTPSGSGLDNGTRNEFRVSDLLSNSYDADGDNLNISVAGTSSGISARIEGGNLVWTASSAGPGWIDYRVSDNVSGATGTQIARIPVTVEHAIVPPEIFTPTYSVTTSGSDNELEYNIRGVISANDPDGDNGQIRYYVGSPEGTTSGRFEINTSTGEFTARFVTGFNNGGAIVHSYPLVFYAVDGEGNVSEAEPFNVTFVEGTNARGPGHGNPIVFDLNNDGFNLVSLTDSQARYQWDQDAALERTGWVGAGDGMLAYDYNQDGVISETDEISFVDYLEGAETDLQGLSAFDTDGDGMFTANDEQWGLFGIWQDDGDGISEDGEYLTLDQIGIGSINLYDETNTVFDEAVDDEGNLIYGESTFTWADGSAGNVADVGFAYADDPSDIDTDNDTITTDSDAESTGAETIASTQAETDTETDTSQVANVDSVNEVSSTTEAEVDPFADITDAEIDRQVAQARQDIAAHNPPKGEEATVVSENAQSAGEENMQEDDKDLLPS